MGEWNGELRRIQYRSHDRTGFITIFVVVVLTIVLHLLRNFFWRISVLEDAGVRESLRRGFTLVRENWKNVGLMWLVMIGLGIVWTVASIILSSSRPDCDRHSYDRSDCGCHPTPVTGRRFQSVPRWSTAVDCGRAFRPAHSS